MLGFFDRAPVIACAVDPALDYKPKHIFEGVPDERKARPFWVSENKQIVELLLQGCDNDEIARQLSMARRTVRRILSLSTTTRKKKKKIKKGIKKKKGRKKRE